MSCPTIFVPSQAYEVEGDCVVNGNLGFQGNGSLFLTNGILTIYGNLVLQNNAVVYVLNGGLWFPQAGYYQYGIYLENNAKLILKNSTMITNIGAADNFALSLSSYGNAVVVFNESSLDTTNSWLLGNLYQNSQLYVVNTLNLPTEIYPSDQTIVSMFQSNVATTWLNFNAGSNATVTVPDKSPTTGTFNFQFGHTEGFAYYVQLISCSCRIGLNSFPNSTMVVKSNGLSTNKAALVFGYYFMGNTGPVTVSNFTVGENITGVFSDSGRILSLQNVYLNPFSWQIYASNTNGYSVTIKSSLINEIASFSSANMIVEDSVLQLAVLEAGGTDAYLTVINSNIWSQNIQAAAGGKLMIMNSSIHGNFVNSVNPGSYINFTNTIDLRNGNSTTVTCNPNAQGLGYPPNSNGVPLCNPYTPLQQCSVVSASADGVISSTPPCQSYPTNLPTFAPTYSRMPSIIPTFPPSLAPQTEAPTMLPSFVPTIINTPQPSFLPTIIFPTSHPTLIPSSAPVVIQIQSQSAHGLTLSAGAVAGIAIGGVVGVAIVAFVVAYLLGYKLFGKTPEMSDKINHYPKSEQL